MQEEEDRNCYKILIAVGTGVFEKLQEKIFNLNARNITLMGIILATISFFFTLLIFMRQMGLQFSNLDCCLICIFSIFSVIPLVITIPFAIPKKYNDLEIFKQKRFDELIRMPEQTLFKDLLYHIKDSYDENIKIYKYRIRLFTCALYFFITADLVFITFLFKIIIWR